MNCGFLVGGARFNSIIAKPNIESYPADLYYTDNDDDSINYVKNINYGYAKYKKNYINKKLFNYYKFEGYNIAVLKKIPLTDVVKLFNNIYKYGIKKMGYIIQDDVILPNYLNYTDRAIVISQVE